MSVPDPLRDLDERLAGIARRLESGIGELGDGPADGDGDVDTLRTVAAEMGTTEP